MNAIILAVGICILISIVVLIIILIWRGPRESSTGAVSQLGPYRNLVLLSDKGGMARVYKAYNSISDRDCVLKVLRQDQLGDADAVKKFIREAEILLKIKKKWPDAPVVSIYKSGTITSAMVELPFIEMEYIPGNMDLSEYLKQKGRMQPEVAEKVIVQIIRALVASHDVGEVHRDLKPGNVLLYDGDPEQVVVCDFGVAKQVDSKSVTIGGYGTAAYMSPEQCTGSRITPASDIYSLGVVFYELLTGKPVFSDDNPVVVMKRHQEEDPASLISKRIPEPFRSLLSIMLRKDPAKRPPLNYILSRLSSKALQVFGYRRSETEPGTKPGSVKGLPKKKLLVGALAGLLLVLSGALGVVYYNLGADSVTQGSTSISSEIAPKPDKKNALPHPDGFGALYLTSTPAGANILIDGDLKGKTPLEVRKVYAGKHQVVFKLKYYQDVSKEILIKKDIVTKEHLKLKRGRGNITVLTTPAGAYVSLNGRKQKGKSPMTISSVKAGKHKLLIHKDTYYDKKVTVEILPDFTEKLELTLDGGNLVFFRNKWIEPEKRNIIVNKEKTKKISKLRKKAENQHKSQLYSECIDTLNKLLKIDPKNSFGLNFLKINIEEQKKVEAKRLREECKIQNESRRIMVEFNILCTSLHRRRRARASWEDQYCLIINNRDVWMGGKILNFEFYPESEVNIKMFTIYQAWNMHCYDLGCARTSWRSRGRKIGENVYISIAKGEPGSKYYYDIDCKGGRIVHNLKKIEKDFIPVHCSQ